MKIAIFAEDVYEDLELQYPLLRLREAGAEVVVVGPEAKAYLSKHGYPVVATLSAAQAVGQDYAAVVVPGGFAPDRLRRDPNVLKLVRDASEGGKVVAAICHAGWVLVSAGVLKGKTVTSTPGIKDDMTNAGATWVDREVVVDGKLVTSRRPDDLPAFCRETIALLESGR
jgi:protease I